MTSEPSYRSGSSNRHLSPVGVSSHMRSRSQSFIERQERPIPYDNASSRLGGLRPSCPPNRLPYFSPKVRREAPFPPLFPETRAMMKTSRPKFIFTTVVVCSNRSFFFLAQSALVRVDR